ncbi:phage holin family protein [Propionivibrio limicola]|uniref:phage holin family protein n=1 Tax=Propionivibrio limicola TaxID=167645 RepID=UPI00129215D1|nr:phage holin family protein [Propionivibrio limicola]
MSAPQGGEQSGLFAALKNISATLLATGKTRLELLGNEIEEEKLRAIRLVFLAQGMAFCLGVGVLLFVALMAALFWESRLVVLGGAAGVFLAGGAFCCVLFKRATVRPEPVFAASIAELQEDIRQLKAALENEQTAR